MHVVYVHEHILDPNLQIPIVLGAPGGYNEKVNRILPTVSDVLWMTPEGGRQSHWKDFCNGWNVHNICIFSSGDLHRLDYKPHTFQTQETMFHNKYRFELDHTVIDCMEEELVRRNKEECSKDYLQKHSTI